SRARGADQRRRLDGDAKERRCRLCRRRERGMIALELDLVEPLGRLIARPWADAVTGLQIDSRRIAEGDLFVAVGGGADFVEHALARGAAAALVPDDAHAALATVAGNVRDRSSARIVAITGSTGKTSTKDILYAICAPQAKTIANEGNYNNELGVPLTLARLEPDHGDFTTKLRS